MSQSTISVSPEKILDANIFGYNLGITNTMLTALIVCMFIVLLGLILGIILPKNKDIKPNKIQTFIEMIGEGLYNFITPMINGRKISLALFSLCGFFFSYIVFASWFGLLPGVGQLYTKSGEGNLVHLFRASTTDLAGTAVLSIIAFVLIQFQGIRELKLGYLSKFINFKSPMGFAVGLLELISELSRLLSFALRLFGNIFAGEVMLKIVGDMSRFGIERLGFLGLPFPSVIIALEIFVALIQAYVFVALFLVFSSLAKEEAH